MTKVRWLAALIAVAGFVTVGAQDYPCDVYMRSAKIYLKQNPPDYKSARMNLEAAYQKCSADPELHYLLALIYADENQLEKMTTEFKAAKEKGYSKPEEVKKVIESVWGREFQNGTSFLEQVDTIRQRMADLEARASDSLTQAQQQKLTAGLQKAIEQAAKHFENCILVDSSRYQPYVNAAAQRIELNQLEKADTLLSRAYQLAPESLSVVLSYGINLYNLQNHDRAIEIFEKGVKLDPNNREALFNLASLYGLKGNRQKSLEIYNSLIEKGMADKDIYFNRGMMSLIEAQETNAQIRSWEDSLEKNPKEESYNKEMANLKAKKDQVLKSAEDDFAKCVELDSQDVDALYQLGFVFMLESKWDPALTNLEKVTVLKDDHRDAWEALSIIYTRKNMPEKAKAAQAKAEELATDSQN